MATPTTPKNKTPKPAAPAPATKQAPAQATPTATAAAATKAVVKATPVAKPVAVEVAKPAATAKPAKPAKPREELVRDSFTMPQSDFKLIAQLKERALAAKRAAKKSELLRAGLQALDKLEAKALVAALDRLAPIKTGRPKKGH